MRFPRRLFLAVICKHVASMKSTVDNALQRYRTRTEPRPQATEATRNLAKMRSVRAQIDKYAHHNTPLPESPELPEVSKGAIMTTFRYTRRAYVTS